jgi:hypothetical protein
MWVSTPEHFGWNCQLAGTFYWGNRHGWCLKLGKDTGFLFEAYLDKEAPNGSPFTWLGAAAGGYPDLNRWYHLAGQFSMANGKTTLSLYVDGVLAKTTQIDGAFPYREAGPFVIGNNRVGNEPFENGLVDDVRLYSRLLTPAEIAALASEPAPGP